MIVFALLIGTTPPAVISLCCLAALLFNIFLLPNFTSRVLERKSDKMLGFSPGLILYPAVLFIISLIFFDEQVFLLIAWGAMAFGDGFANLAGRRYGSHFLGWNRDKSWEGIVAFLFFGITATLLLLLILPDSLMLGFNIEHWFWVILLAHIFSAIWETVPNTIDDNLIVPFSAAFSAYFFHLVLTIEGIQLPGAKVSLFYLGIALSLGGLSLLTRRISWSGATVGSGITLLLMLAFDWLGLLAIATFFILGTAASAWKKKEKEEMGLAEANAGKRGYANVLANAAIPFFLALIYLVLPSERERYEIMMLAGFAAALSDTLSSEVGNIYGKNYVNIFNLRKGVRGKDGMISLEGTLSGLIGALLMGIIYPFTGGDIKYVPIIFVAGFAGNLSDSLLGATLQHKGFLNNHTVNFFNTLLAAFIAYGLLSF